MTRLRRAYEAVRVCLEQRRTLYANANEADQALFAADQEYARAKAMHAMDCPALDDVDYACDCEPVEEMAAEDDLRRNVRPPDL